MSDIKDIKQLIYQTLEKKGLLSTIQAQIRATVYKQIDEVEQNRNKESPFYWENPKCQKLFLSEEGKFALQIIKEFLNFYNMDYTNSVFSQESNLKEEIDKGELYKKLKLKENNEKPIFLQIIDSFKKGEKIQISEPPAPNKAKEKEPVQKIKDPVKVEPVRAGVSKQQQQKIQQKQQAKQQQSTQKFNSNQMNNNYMEEKSQSNSYAEDFEVEEDLGVFEEVELDDEQEEQSNKKGRPNDKEKKNNPFFESEDFGNSIGASQSMGQDMSVDSLALENYDYIEDIKTQNFKKK